MMATSINSKPRPMPRMNGTHGGHTSSPVTRGQEYSSSEGEEDGLMDDCAECEECARNQAQQEYEENQRHHHQPRSTGNMDSSLQRGRLYSYVSGSDGEADDARQRSRRRPRQRRDDWQRAPPGESPPSSRSSSGSRCESDRTEQRPRARVAMGTMDSTSTGENVYSRINDTATLPLCHIPPPPHDTPGPAVPPRPAQVLTRAGQPPSVNYHPLSIPGQRATYHELECCDFEPQFLQTTPDGSVFVPPAPELLNSAPMGGPVAFPRTVPRTASLPRHSRIVATPTNSTNTLQSRATAEAIPMVTHDQSNPNIHPSCSFDRQNVTFNAQTTLLNNVPQFPSIHSDFRDYGNYNSTSYRVKKKLKGKCTWKCSTLVLIPLTIVLLILLAYFLPMAVYDLNWRLKPRHSTVIDLKPTQSPPDTTVPKRDSVITVNQYVFGKRLEETVPPKGFWRAQFSLPNSEYVKFNLSVPNYVVVAIYLRRSTHPTHAQYDFAHILDGNRLASSSDREKRALGSQTSNTAFIEYLDAGAWFVFIYNDDTEPHELVFTGGLHEAPTSSCPDSCNGHGECVDGQCQCFPGYKAWDCSESVCPFVCHGNGHYMRGECKCYPGFKGKECELTEDECADPACSGNGKCVRGQCACSPGFKGPECAEVDCIPPHCSQHGVCDHGVCVCYPGFLGSDCSLIDTNSTLCVKDCSGRGIFDYNTHKCVCSANWVGENCEIEICSVDCVHGTCENQRCACNPGWQGAQCDLLQCDKNCNGQGNCNNGTCVCKPGFNGRYCSLDGCPNGCNNHGSCQQFRDGWHCSCQDGWKGKACNVAMETDCGNGRDDDGDDLPDCLDPDCCMDVECSQNKFCNTAPDPMEILLRKQPPSNTASFYARMRFLVEDDSVQSYAKLDSFNETQVSVIRGKVIATDGSPLIGVRVSVVNQPMYGFTLTRELGLFDILVNGGGSVIVQFQRQPFSTKQIIVIVPWNEMVTINTVTLQIAGDAGDGTSEECQEISHDHYNVRPVIMSTWQHTQLGACPSKSAVIPESQVLQESQRIPGTDVYLVYHSSEAPGYMSTILIQLTPDVVPVNLALVHLRVAVEGVIVEKVFEAQASLKYTYAWDRRNAYNQKVYGIVSARVDVGYEYESCGEVFWHTQAASMSGYDITSTEIGGWNLHIHHIYNYQEGILHKGDGTNIYLKEQPRKIVNILGTGKQRRLDCRNCDGSAENSRLMAPVALASGRDGSLYVGDFNFIRKLGASRSEVNSILQLDMPEVPYKYFMTVSPLDARLYISDYQTKQILIVKTMGSVSNLQSNHEVMAGTGEQCYPGDEDRCGDGGPAVDAKLFYPKGIAINKDGTVYFADGANIRMIGKDKTISTVIGHQGQPTQWRPLPCKGTLDVDKVTLHWPTALAINPLDDTLHILDNNMVLKLTKDHKGILVVAGYPLHCPPITSRMGSLLEEEQSAPKLATEVVLKSPQDITFSPSAELFIVESDGAGTNRVRMVSTDGTISHYAGSETGCDCAGDDDCECVSKRDELATKAQLNNPTAVTVTPDNVLHIADMGNLCIHSVLATLPSKENGQYKILHPETQEQFYFNGFGQHVATKHLVTDEFIYNFTYNVNSYYGKLVKVTDAAGGVLTIKRDYTTQATEIIPPGGQKCHFSMDNMGMLHSFTSADNATTFYTYFSNVELLETKKTSTGLVYLYDYDDNGRLVEVIQPTGERTRISTDVDATGALARVHTEHKDPVVMATNGHLLSILHGESYTHVSYLQDGSLIVEYPFNMAVTLETSPHPLLHTEHQLQLKRKVILPGNVVHRLEWRFYPRYQRDEGTKVMTGLRRRVRVGGRGSVAPSRHVMHDDLVQPTASYTEGYEEKTLTLNGVTLLIMEYDRDTNTETFYNTDKESILTVHYNRAGSILRATPSSPLAGVNITYNDNGKMLDWDRGPINIQLEYDDKSGNLVKRRYGSRAVYRFIYKAGNKPTDVILPSGKQYQLHYDQSGNLKSIVMPSLARHRFRSLISLGVYRVVYQPPAGHGFYMHDYSSSGQLRRVSYPSGQRRLTYYYAPSGRLRSLYYDWADVHYEYYDDDHLLHMVNISDRVGAQFACSLIFKPNETLIQSHEARYSSGVLSLSNAKFTYHYDAFLRVSSVVSIIGATVTPSCNFTFDPNTGQLKKMKNFIFDYPRLNREIIRDANMEIIRERDSVRHLTDVWFRFNNHVKFTQEVKYDELNRLKQWRRKIGTSDLKSYEYMYDVDGNLVMLDENGQTTWRYEIDENSNIEKITHHNRERTFEINDQNEIVSDGQASYIFDKDGYLIQRGSEVFEYNSRGQLSHAFEAGHYDLFYYYDGLQRLVARRDVLSGEITQYYYSDLYHKQRITHIYEHSTSQLYTLYYDSHNNLFAMQRDQDFYYIALDPIGSPIVIFNSIGSVVKLIIYDPLGVVLTDSSSDFKFALGFQCGIQDPVTDLVFLKGRVYDPFTGRWTGPDYSAFLDDLDHIWDMPEATNHYAYKGIVNRQQPHQLNIMTDIPSWLNELGYDLESLIPEVNFIGRINPVEHPHKDSLMPVISAFECAFNRDMDSVMAISTVPKSKITTSHKGLSIRSFEPITSLFGNDVVLTAKEDKVSVDFLENPDEKLALLASTLLNNSEIVEATFTIHGRDVHYFVKRTLDEARSDAKTLALKPDGDVVGGVNVTIHRHHESPEVMLYADYRLHGNHSVFNIRYGTSVEQERERILNHAMARAVEVAWLIERELAQSNKQSMYAWTQQQKLELKSKGSIANVRTAFLRDVSKYPELADDPKNIRFIPVR